jgi:hypothetical protein
MTLNLSGVGGRKIARSTAAERAIHFPFVRQLIRAAEAWSCYYRSPGSGTALVAASRRRPVAALAVRSPVTFSEACVGASNTTVIKQIALHPRHCRTEDDCRTHRTRTHHYRGGGLVELEELRGAVEFEDEVSDGILALLDEVLVELPASARLIDPVDFDCESLVEGVVAAELPVDELVRGGALEEFDGDVPGELGEDVEGLEGDVDGYLPEDGPDGFEPDVDGFELEVEG